jgi:hypothetical protein
MRTTLLAAVVVASFLLPRPAAAQLAVQLRFDLPVVLPALVVIEPGIQVVPHVNEEIFFVDGFYWVRRDTHWYRSHDHRRGWVQVEQRGVPPRLERIPRGHYRQWEPARGGHDRVERREDRREDRKDGREQQREREKRSDEQRREGDKKDREQRREHDKRD